MVLAAGGSDAASARAALADLCARYWYPLYAWLRRDGASHESAQDLVQEFLLDVIEHHRLGVADPQRGRFRSFLLASLRNFRANAIRRGNAARRGGGVRHVPIDFSAADSVWSREPAHELTADRLFDRKWALELLDRALRRLEESAMERGRQELFARIRPYLTGYEDASSYAEIAAQLSLQPGTVKVAVHRWREQLRGLIRAEIRQTVATDEEVDDELDCLLRALG